MDRYMDRFERICRAYLKRLGYTVESPNEKAIRLVQAKWIEAGIGQGE